MRRSTRNLRHGSMPISGTRAHTIVPKRLGKVLVALKYHHGFQPYQMKITKNRIPVAVCRAGES